MPENEPVPTENLTENLSDPGYCPPARARLVIFEGAEAGRIVDLEEAELRVGRGEGNDLVLPSNKVSKRHLQISWAPGGVYRAEDLGSWPTTSQPDCCLLPDTAARSPTAR